MTETFEPFVLDTAITAAVLYHAQRLGIHVLIERFTEEQGDRWVVTTKYNPQFRAEIREWELDRLNPGVTVANEFERAQRRLTAQ